MKTSFLSILILFAVSFSFGQTAVNQKDAKGKYHGDWKKYYQNKQLRYEGQFDHGKEVGIFRFYCETCGDQPEVIKVFSATDNSAMVSFFTKTGKLVSKGKMLGKKKVGEWLYYAEEADHILIRENYVDGKLQGDRITYYPDGAVTETVPYVNGKEEGLAVSLSPKGQILKRLVYANGLLNGPAQYFDNRGILQKKGVYKDGAKFGNWVYYKNGKLLFEKSY